ncbi:homoserine kinase [Candidatus Methanomassiliicoccus intestinalis]|uniref:Homoserine kinase n=1 Tax=Methanomassiliicoccus intestinalis (strain Issoire-Mx1) TaxID=1295009 RepID=R9TBM8_METII|nr:homoserine kinase [Candidatus Methanomassiliicoccus intestinalis]AGN26843.1 homoserine kinase [Candidatus Methanomassiliicoccus intestinalis Issoire-Mx1]TQS83816.1 MAG: homoserine kinase [Candidatus Methanomassiliicoccus intestinalis]
MEKVKVVAPATLSNLGSGFDVFGMALSEPFDIIEARKTSEPGVIIESVEGWGAEVITLDAALNSTGVAAAEVLKKSNADFGIAFNIKKGFRPGSGIGSSGASAAGGAVAANLLLKNKLPPRDIVACAAESERVTSGSFHADNVGPCVLGGFTVIRCYEPLELKKITPPKNLGVVVVMPSFTVKTLDARTVIPKQVKLSDMIYEVGNASSLVLGMCSGDVDLIGKSMTDIVVEPSRSKLNPGLMDAKKAAIEAGAAGSFLGGSGPCVIAIFDNSLTDGKPILDAMLDSYKRANIAVDKTWITTWGEGCRSL